MMQWWMNRHRGINSWQGRLVLWLDLRWLKRVGKQIGTKP